MTFQQIDHVGILAHDVVEQQLHLAAHRLPERVVEVGINHRQRSGRLPGDALGTMGQSEGTLFYQIVACDSAE